MRRFAVVLGQRQPSLPEPFVTFDDLGSWNINGNWNRKVVSIAFRVRRTRYKGTATLVRVPKYGWMPASELPGGWLNLDLVQALQPLTPPLLKAIAMAARAAIILQETAP